MKNYKIIMVYSIIISLFWISVGYGQVNTIQLKDNVQTIVTEKRLSEIESKMTKAARGRLLSSVSIQISDEGNGILGVYADTLCHSSMKEIYMTIYLDVWNETYGDWDMVDYYEYRFEATGNPNDSLSMVVVSFDLEGLVRNREYRLRGMHMARGFDLTSEMITTETEGIPLH